MNNLQKTATAITAQGSNTILTDLAGMLYGVTTSNKIVSWNGAEWIQCDCKWNIRDMVFDNKGNCWVVGTENNVGIYDFNTQSITMNYGFIGGWQILSIDFDQFGTLWCVGSNGNVGTWNGYSWNDQGLVGNWKLQSICVRNPLGGGAYWGVSTSNELSVWGFDGPGKWGKDLFPHNSFISISSTPPPSTKVYTGGILTDNGGYIIHDGAVVLNGVIGGTPLLTMAFKSFTSK